MAGAAAHATVVATLLLVGMLLDGCGANPRRTDADGPYAPDAVPRVEPLARTGNMESYEVFGRRYYTQRSSRNHRERGLASWYGEPFHGRKTSSGEVYDMHRMTAAHRSLPLPTYVRVTNLENGRTAVVRINDRGPFVGERVIDLSYAAARKLGVVRNGTAQVEVVSVDPRDHGGRVPRRERVAARGAPASRPAMAGADVAVPTTAPQLAIATSQPAVATPGRDRAIYVQAGAFGQRANAEALSRRLRGQLSAPVLLREPNRNAGAALYRVQIGPFSDQAEARTLIRELGRLGIQRPLVVAR
ncbi:MAG: septal ring lytic transglycosylase RlpA family protein [Chromatiaceae bacterium]|nr:MAG: septal ring lytic transglycosylase RlpA family protein [Chromatiaceae bacterium]